MKQILCLLTLVLGSFPITSAQAGCFPCCKPKECSCAPAPEAYCRPTPKKVKVTKEVFVVECKQICVPGVRCCLSNLLGGRKECQEECVMNCDQTQCDTSPGETPPCGKVKVVKVLKTKEIDAGEKWVWEWKVEGCADLPGCCKPECPVPEPCAPGCCSPVAQTTTTRNPVVPEVPAAISALPQPSL